MQLVFCEKKTMWFIGIEVEQETSAPPPKKKSWISPCKCPLYRGVRIIEVGKVGFLAFLGPNELSVMSVL